MHVWLVCAHICCVVCEHVCACVTCVSVCTRALCGVWVNMCASMCLHVWYVCMCGYSCVYMYGVSIFVHLACVLCACVYTHVQGACGYMHMHVWCIV